MPPAPAAKKVDSLDHYLNEQYRQFGIDQKKSASWPPEKKVQYLIERLQKSLSTITKIVQQEAARRGARLDESVGLAGNLSTLLDQHGMSNAQTPTDQAGDQDLQTLAEVVNAQLPCPFAKLPPRGIDAVRLVLSSYRQQKS